MQIGKCKLESANWKVQIENCKVQIGKCKLKILFFQFAFFNYFTRSLEDRPETREKNNLCLLVSIRGSSSLSIRGSSSLSIRGSSSLSIRGSSSLSIRGHFFQSNPYFSSLYCKACLVTPNRFATSILTPFESSKTCLIIERS